MTLNEHLTFFAIKLLLEHDEMHDPYMDGYPTERAMAARHRKSCDICKFVDRHRVTFRRFTAAVAEK